MIPWLPREHMFPDVSRALTEPNGLLAAGGDLSPQRILTAYQLGIFPWTSPDEPLLWWSPDPRMVLFPDQIRITRSLAKTLRNAAYEVRLDSAFDEVMLACANAPREGQNGTWISDEMREAYGTLHRMGFAHSVETWIDGQLAGGLYGMAIGKAFYGESMFARVRDASKIALAHLGAHLKTRSFGIIDCQMETAHLASMGALPISRRDFTARLDVLCVQGEAPACWPMDAIDSYFRNKAIKGSA